VDNRYGRCPQGPAHVGTPRRLTCEYVSLQDPFGTLSRWSSAPQRVVQVVRVRELLCLSTY